MARIIFLHGASSAGKTTLAQALQEALDRPFLHLSIDHLRDAGALPQAALARGDFSWADMRPAFFDGFHRAVAGFADAGNDIILEHILDTPGWHTDLTRLLAGHDVLFVGLVCPVAVLEHREAQRGDRPLGSAAHDAHHIHAGLSYDLTLDGTAPPEQNVAHILAALDLDGDHSPHGQTLASRDPQA